MRDDDEPRATPPAVVGAVAVGTAPLPFLAVYAVLFIIHGGIHPVAPPDVTTTAHGELVAGIVALVLFVLVLVSLLWLLNGRRRWPFAIVQLAVLGTAFDFVLDATKGGTSVSILLIVTSLIALGCGFAPQAWEHVGCPVPPALRRLADSRAGHTAAADDVATR